MKNYDKENDYKAPVGVFLEEVDVETESIEKDKKKKDDSGDSIKAYAQMLQGMGGEDSILAHITPDEADLLKMLGGSGDISKLTGLMMFNPDGTEVDEDEYETNIAKQLAMDLEPVTPEQSPPVKLIPIEGFGNLEIGQEGVYPVDLTPDYSGEEGQAKYYWGVDKSQKPDQPFGLEKMAGPMSMLTGDIMGLPTEGTGGGKSFGMYDEEERKRLFG